MSLKCKRGRKKETFPKRDEKDERENPWKDEGNERNRSGREILGSSCTRDEGKNEGQPKGVGGLASTEVGKTDNETTFNEGKVGLPFLACQRYNKKRFKRNEPCIAEPLSLSE